MYPRSTQSTMSAASSNKLAVVDASVWVARYLPHDRFHRQSRDWFDAWILHSGEMVSPILVLGEVGGAIARQTGDSVLGQRAVAEIERNPALVLIELDSTLGKLTADIATTLRLRGADAVYAALARRLPLPLITWDQELISRGADVLDAHTPIDT
jgi:predicted nucleic acid-binding protein